MQKKLSKGFGTFYSENTVSDSFIIKKYTISCAYVLENSYKI